MKQFHGHIHGKDYIKHVSWNTAVLWKTKEISVSKQDVLSYFPLINRIVFIDDVKLAQWSAPKENVTSHMTLKKEGQEEQYYIPIDLFTRETLQQQRKEETRHEAFGIKSEEKKMIRDVLFTVRVTDAKGFPLVYEKQTKNKGEFMKAFFDATKALQQYEEKK